MTFREFTIEAHKITRALKEEFPNIDYRTQYSISFRYLVQYYRGLELIENRTNNESKFKYNFQLLLEAPKVNEVEELKKEGLYLLDIIDKSDHITEEDVNKEFKRISLLIHPDKNKNIDSKEFVQLVEEKDGLIKSINDVQNDWENKNEEFYEDGKLIFPFNTEVVKMWCVYTEGGDDFMKDSIVSARYKRDKLNC